MYTLILLTLVIIIFWLLFRLNRANSTGKNVSHLLDETSTILENLNDGVFECDTSLVVLRANKAAEKILGVEGHQIVGRVINEANPRDETERVLSLILFPPLQVKSEPNSPSFSYDIFLDKKGERKIRVFTIPKHNRQTKKLEGYIKIIRDVSIETIVEKHKSDLVSIVSHQLLTPIAGIKWILKSLEDGDGGPLNDKQTELIKRATVIEEGMAGLVSDILDVTKIEQARFTYDKKPGDIVALVKETINSRMDRAELRGIKLAATYDIPQKTLNIDRGRLGIAVANLIDNAIEYSPSGSTVDVHVSDRMGKIYISVRDRGIGIPETEQNRMFEKFFRADNAKRVRSGGTGLGLYLTKHIVEDHSGVLSFISKEGAGATFTIELHDNK